MTMTMLMNLKKRTVGTLPINKNKKINNYTGKQSDGFYINEL